MNDIRISDATIRRFGREDGAALSFREKIELAKLLDRLEVSAVELDRIRTPRADALLIKSVAAAVGGSAVAVPVGLSEESVRETWEALRGAAHPRLQVIAPVSAVQMEYLLRSKPDALLARIADTVRACRALCADVEFAADDATRADGAFLRRIFAAAAEAGASAVTVCDAAGTLLPGELAAFLTALRAEVPALAGVPLGVECSDALSLADAGAVAAVEAGVREIKVSAWPTGCAHLDRLAGILAARGETLGVRCPVRTAELGRVTEQIAALCRRGRAGSTPFEDGVRDAEADGTEPLTLTGRDDRAAVRRAAEKLGYDLTDEDADRVFESVRAAAARKGTLGARELDAIVASAAMQAPPLYRLESYVINAGNIIDASAQIRLRRRDRVLQGVSVGDGPVDAAFLAVEQITGRHYELDDFQIRAITEGREAMGQTVVRLRAGGKLYAGCGTSTDVIGASILAYVSALNKIAWEEEET